MRTAIATKLCKWCGHYVTEGSHHTNGDFDQFSVTVTEEEINRALRNGGVVRPRSKVRYNIALGKHSGVYNPE